jgi:hypothetical protein
MRVILGGSQHTPWFVRLPVVAFALALAWGGHSGCGNGPAREAPDDAGPLRGDSRVDPLTVARGLGIGDESAIEALTRQLRGTIADQAPAYRGPTTAASAMPELPPEMADRIAGFSASFGQDGTRTRQATDEEVEQLASASSRKSWVRLAR